MPRLPLPMTQTSVPRTSPWQRGSRRHDCESRHREFESQRLPTRANQRDPCRRFLGHASVSNDNPALFTIAPSLASNGTLTYTPNGTAGTATLSVTLTDDESLAERVARVSKPGFQTCCIADFEVCGACPTPGEFGSSQHGTWKCLLR